MEVRYISISRFQQINMITLVSNSILLIFKPFHFIFLSILFFFYSFLFTFCFAFLFSSFISGFFFSFHFFSLFFHFFSLHICSLFLPSLLFFLFFWLSLNSKYIVCRSMSSDHFIVHCSHFPFWNSCSLRSC